jgi:ppGpp synthetase/RelA/SpoT-type nucleotidyltranferase
MLADFEAQSEALERLARDVRDLLLRLLREKGLPVHEVNTRVKTRRSLERKIRHHDPPYTGLNEVTDLVGARVITYFADDVDRVADLIESEFRVDRTNSVDKRAIIEPDRFGYLSLHYVCGLSTDRLALREWARFADLRFEVQIRSILQHAWAEIEHDLGYHVEQAVPAPVRRRFSRLAGLLEVADAEFKGIRSDIDEYQAQIARSTPRDLAELPLDRDSLMAWVDADPDIRTLDVVVAADLGWLADRPNASYMSKRVEDFTWLGISSIAEVRELFLSKSDRVARFAAAWKPKRADVEVPRGVGLWFLFLLEAADRNRSDGPVDLPPRYVFSPARMARLLAAKASADRA